MSRYIVVSDTGSTRYFLTVDGEWSKFHVQAHNFGSMPVAKLIAAAQPQGDCETIYAAID